MLDLDDFDIEELLCLRDSLETFLDILDLRERAYCEGWEEFEDLHSDTTKAAAKLRNRIKGLAIALGIQAEFLEQYANLQKQHNFAA